MQVVRQLMQSPHTYTFENGGFGIATDRQSVLKGQALAEALGQAKVSAVHISSRESVFGLELIGILNLLSETELVNSNLEKLGGFSLKPAFFTRKSAVGAVSEDNSMQLAQLFGETPLTNAEAIQGLIELSRSRNAVPGLLLQGDEAKAAVLAKQFPGLAWIQFRSNGAASKSIRWVGKTALFTPGEHGKAVLKVDLIDGRVRRIHVIELFENVKDDVPTSATYRRYLQRVAAEGLLARAPRIETDPYAGNLTCMGCHPKEAQIWKKSQHSSALTTLHKVGHQKDPDCVGCHVVGLESESGFRDEGRTPQLKQVGCESCHGPGKNHSQKPSAFSMPKVGDRSCTPCHVPDHSPGFSFPKAWQKIAH